MKKSVVKSLVAIFFVASIFLFVSCKHPAGSNSSGENIGLPKFSSNHVMFGKWADENGYLFNFTTQGLFVDAETTKSQDKLVNIADALYIKAKSDNEGFLVYKDKKANKWCACYYYSEGDGSGKISFESVQLKDCFADSAKKLIANLDQKFDNSYMAKMKNDFSKLCYSVGKNETGVFSVSSSDMIYGKWKYYVSSPLVGGDFHYITVREKGVFFKNGENGQEVGYRFGIHDIISNDEDNKEGYVYFWEKTVQGQGNWSGIHYKKEAGKDLQIKLIQNYVKDTYNKNWGTYDKVKTNESGSFYTAQKVN